MNPKQHRDNLLSRFLVAIQHAGKRLFQIAEGLADTAFGSQNNPFYYLGGLTFFFLIVLVVSGFYLYFFYEANIEGAYASIERLTHEQWYFGGVMRSMHRYVSDAMVLTMVLHMLRRFFNDRYNGGRSFSWITGVPMLWIVMIIGLLGYWLVWDKQAQFIVVRSFEWLDWLPIIAEPVSRNFLTNEDLTNSLFRLVMVTHLGLPLFLLAAVLLHTNRLHKPKIIPPTQLAAGTMLALLILCLVKPALSQAPADLSLAPGFVHLDWFYLAAYPLVIIWPLGVVWALIGGGTLILMSLPWLPPRKPDPVADVDLASCSGCNLCVLDCPYEAIRLVPRSDGHPRYRLEAQVSESKCVSCGICTGSCPLSAPFRHTDRFKSAIEMPQAGVQDLRDKILEAMKGLSAGKRIIIFGCNYGIDVTRLEHAGAVGINLECIGMLPASFIDYALRQGADGVFITGCRMGDCYHRLGNQFLLQRLDGERKPKLSRRVTRERIGFSLAAQADQKKLLSELELFYRSLPSSDAVEDARHMQKGHKSE
ncbi:MAG: hydrogenase iron-sulfur subunit [Gammaproteobacteria bacterium]|nr:hydrogenase iron-sulfur subunit [Gammaproteobacteria bacterium]